MSYRGAQQAFLAETSTTPDFGERRQGVSLLLQTFGAMGMTKETPLQLMASHVRNMRIYDGPSEVHRWVVARKLLKLR
jgi:alkylation response protein AidB-like acyl-CoA dehydrogenase